MLIQGVAVLAFCYLTGQLAGEMLGYWLGIKANVGGVGFAMLLLMAVTGWLQKRGQLPVPSVAGIQFWNQMYIPIVVAMAATQNVRVAVSGGVLALLVGVIPALLCFALIPVLSRRKKESIRQTPTAV